MFSVCDLYQERTEEDPKDQKQRSRKTPQGPRIRPKKINRKATASSVTGGDKCQK